MKLQRFFLALTCCALVFSACSDDDEYSVKVTAGENGKATANPTKAEEGQTVTLTATPDEGYEFSAWKVEKGDAKLASTTAATTTFTMPANNVEISAAFVAKAAAKYKVTVTGGSDSATVTASPEEAAEGETVTLTFTVIETEGVNVSFEKWEVTKGTVTIENETETTATFKMPAEDVEIRANYGAMTDGPQA